MVWDSSNNARGAQQIQSYIDSTVLPKKKTEIKGLLNPKGRGFKLIWLWKKVEAALLTLALKLLWEASSGMMNLM